MVRIGEQFRDAIRRERVVITADRPVSIKEVRILLQIAYEQIFFRPLTRQVPEVTEARNDHLP